MNEAEKEKILKLSALFKELAEKGTWFESIDTKGVWHKNAFPEPVSDLSRWRVADKPVEPKKIIVLTKCINTIDMEFARHDENWSIGKLDGIYGHSYPYSKLNCGDFECCRVRQNHIHYYNGVRNPLPDGLLVTLYTNDGKLPKTYKSQDIDWYGLRNVKGYDVLDTLPEYKYGWEK